MSFLTSDSTTTSGTNYPEYMKKLQEEIARKAGTQMTPYLDSSGSVVAPMRPEAPDILQTLGELNTAFQDRDYSAEMGQIARDNVLNSTFNNIGYDVAGLTGALGSNFSDDMRAIGDRSAAGIRDMTGSYAGQIGDMASGYADEFRDTSSGYAGDVRELGSGYAGDLQATGTGYAGDLQDTGGEYAGRLSDMAGGYAGRMGDMGADYAGRMGDMGADYAAGLRDMTGGYAGDMRGLMGAGERAVDAAGEYATISADDALALGNPYREEMTDAAMRRINESHYNNAAGIAGQAARRAAFGGSGEAIANAANDRSRMKEAGDAASRIAYDSYNTGSGLASQNMGSENTAINRRTGAISDSINYDARQLGAAAGTDVGGYSTSAGIDLGSLSNAASTDMSGLSNAAGTDIAGLTSAAGMDYNSRVAAAGLDMEGRNTAAGLDINSLNSAAGLDIGGRTAASNVATSGLNSAAGMDVGGYTNAAGLEAQGVAAASGMNTDFVNRSGALMGQQNNSNIATMNGINSADSLTTNALDRRLGALSAYGGASDAFRAYDQANMDSDYTRFSRVQNIIPNVAGTSFTTTPVNNTALIGAGIKAASTLLPKIFGG